MRCQNKGVLKGPQQSSVGSNKGNQQRSCHIHCATRGRAPGGFRAGLRHTELLKVKKLHALTSHLYFEGIHHGGAAAGGVTATRLRFSYSRGWDWKLPPVYSRSCNSPKSEPLSTVSRTSRVHFCPWKRKDSDFSLTRKIIAALAHRVRLEGTVNQQELSLVPLQM